MVHPARIVTEMNIISHKPKSIFFKKKKEEWKRKNLNVSLLVDYYLTSCRLQRVFFATPLIVLNPGDKYRAGNLNLQRRLKEWSQGIKGQFSPSRLLSYKQQEEHPSWSIGNTSVLCGS